MKQKNRFGRGSNVIRIFICPGCGRTRLVSKFLKAECPICGTSMDTLAVTYEAWVELSEEERKQISEEWLQTGEDKYKKGNLFVTKEE